MRPAHWLFEFRNCRGYRYLYLVQKARTPKGPRNVRQIYLGTADSVFRRLNRPSPPLKSFPFGLSAALLKAAEETGLLASLQRRLSPEAMTAAAHLITLQILGRAEKPLSREGMDRWYPTSGLPLLFPAPRSTNGDNLRRALRVLFDTGRRTTAEEPILTRARVHAIEEDVFRTLLQRGLHPRYLIFDGTNFFAYHRGDRWFARGRSKQKRFDLNLVGLGLATVETIPILSETYPGNLPDTKAFARAFDALLKRLEHLEVRTEELTLVFDRGNNSTANFDEVVGLLHVIAALDRQQASRLLATPLSEFHEVVRVVRKGKEETILGHSTPWEGFDRAWRALVVYRASTAKEQEKRWERTRKEVLATVAGWQARLASGTSKGRLPKSWMRDLVDLIPRDYQGMFDYRLEQRDGKDWPVCAVVEKAEARLRASFGKTALITDFSEKELSDREFVEGWRTRWEVEEDFRWLKDRYVMSVKPIWVWHPAAVPGHIFLCVMGLMLLRYQQWKIRDLGLSMEEMVERLRSIRLAVVAKETGPQLVLEQMSRDEAELVNRLGLLDLVPRTKSAAT